MNSINPQLEKEIDRLIITLNSVGSSIRNNAVNRLVEIGEPAFEPVVEASQINNSLLRRKTCDVLGLMGDPRAVKPLISLLTDKNKYVRRRAANALILVGDERAVKPLCVALNDPEPKVSARAAIALGNISDESAIPSLVLSLDDWRSEVSVTAGAALNKLGVKGKKARKIHESKKEAEPRSNSNNIVICPGCGEENDILNNFCFSCGSLINVSIQQIEKMEQKKDVDGLIKALNNHNSDYKTETIRALSNSDNEKTLEAIITALNDDSWMVRCEAAEVLGKIGNPLAVETLTKTLDDANSFVICDTLDALAEIGDTSAINSIHNMLKNIDDDVRVHAEEALLKIAHNVSNLPKNIQEDVNKILKEKKKKHFMDLTYLLNSPDRKIRNNAVNQLANDPDSFEIVLNVFYSADNVRKRGICDIFGIMGDPRAVNPLIQLLDDLDVSVRRKAATALIKVNNKEAVDPLCSALTDSDFKVRLRVVEALGKIGDPRAIDPLIKSSQDSDTVGKESIKALNKIGWKPGKDEKSAYFWIGHKKFDKCVEIGEPAVIPLIRTFDNYGETRKNALNAIVQIGEPAVEPLINTIENTNKLIKRTACDALGLISDKRAVLPLIETMNDSSFKVRLNSAKALGDIGDSRAIDVLISSSMDSYSEVSEESVKSLNKIGWNPEKDERSAVFLIGQKRFDECVEIGEPAIIPLINEFNSDNSETRKNALNAIVKIGQPAVEPLINSINNANTLIKRTAYDALGLIGDIKAVNPLCKALLDTDTRVRISAAEALGNIGDKSAIPSLALLLDDTNISVSQAAKEALKKFRHAGQKIINEHEDKKAAKEREKLIESLELHYSTKKEITHEDFEIIVNAKYVNGLIKVLIGDLVYEKDNYPMFNDFLPEPIQSIDMDVTFPCVAANHLGEIGDERAVQPLNDTLLNEYSNIRIRRACLRALDDMGTIHSYNTITNSLPNLDGELFISAVDYLNFHGLDLLEEKGDIVGLINVFSMYDIDREYPIAYKALWNLERLNDAGMPVVKHLLKAMDDESYKNSKYCIKCHFVRGLGDLGDKSAVNPLTEIMNTDPDPNLRDWATLSLYKLGSKDVLDSILEKFKNSNTHFRTDVTVAFMHAKEKRAVNLIIDGLHSSNEKIRSISAQALGEISDPIAVWGLISVSNDPVISVREAATLALCKIGDKRAYQIFIEKLKDESPYIRRIATKALTILDQNSSSINDTESDKLQPEFKYPNLNLHNEAPIKAIKNNDPLSLKKFIEKLNYPEECDEARVALIKIGEPAVKPLIENLGDHKETVQDQSAIVLSNMGGIAVLPLINALENENKDIQAYAAAILGNIRDVRAVEPLIKVIETPPVYNIDPHPDDPEWDVQVASAISLGNIGDTKAIKPLKILLNDVRPEVVEAATEALNKIGSEHKAIKTVRPEKILERHETGKKHQMTDEKMNVDEDEKRIANYKPTNDSNNLKYKGKRFIHHYFNVFVPREWSKDVNSVFYLDGDDGSNVCLKRFNPEVDLFTTSSALIDNNTNLKIYIDLEKTNHVRNREVASEGYIDIAGVKGFRIDWISDTPVESFLKYGETIYHEGTNILFIKNNREYIIRFFSDVKSLNESNLFEIRDDINFIITNFQTKSLNIIKND